MLIHVNIILLEFTEVKKMFDNCESDKRTLDSISEAAFSHVLQGLII